MMRTLIAAFLIISSSLAMAGPKDIVPQVIDRHVLPGFERLSYHGKQLAATAAQDCLHDSIALRRAYHDAFDAWLGVSHLRFGPTEVDNRAFALVFWPDPRGKTSKAIRHLIRAKDKVVENTEVFRSVSVAARGFYALERLLFDPSLVPVGPSDYRCKFIQAITSDIARTADLIHIDWVDRYAPMMHHPGGADAVYETPKAVVAELFKSLSTGLQFTSELRLGRPLGTVERPRPNRAEARRSDRSLRHVDLSLRALHDLADRLAVGHPETASALDIAFAAAFSSMRDIDDPTFSNVTIPSKRLKIEILQQRVDRIREIVAADLGPALGVAAGFNALDGD